MTKNTEQTCAIFFKVADEKTLRSVAGEIEYLSMVFRSHLTQIIEENKANLSPRYAEYKEGRIPFQEARQKVTVLPELKVYRNRKWEDA